MSDVIQLKAKPTKSPVGEVRISAGTVTASTEPRDVGRFMYFVTFVDPDCYSLGVWDGATHGEALEAAHEWEVDGAVLVEETVANLH